MSRSVTRSSTARSRRASRSEDQELCAQLGLSRTPVREALARLEADGLVETAPQSFTRVAALDRRAARDAFPVVAAMHALAAELACRSRHCWST